jgi:APA family basic amino acid/polyamine antiporter
MEKENKNNKLRRELSLFDVTIYGIGVILGAGIYAIIGESAGVAGNAIWLSFIFAALIAAFTGLSYAELSSMYPKTAAEYNYTRNAFSRESLAFVVGWIMIIAGIISSAAVSLGFAGYFSYIFHTPIVLTAIMLVFALSVINFIGIKESSRFNTIATLIEFSGLVIIILVGIWFLGFSGGPSVNYLESPNGFPGIFGAITLIFFAFIGFEGIANISEETKNATKIIPKALLLSLLISTVLYILVSLSAVSVIGWQGLSESKAPLTEVAVKGFGSEASVIFSIIALFATANTALIMMIVASRMLYGMSKNKSLPGFLSRVHYKRGTPFISVFTIMILVMLVSTIGNLGLAASLTDIGIFIAYFFVNISLIALRFRKPDFERPFKSPLNIGRFPILAFLGAISCLLILFYFNIYIILAEMAVIIAGFVVYKLMSLRKG